MCPFPQTHAVARSKATVDPVSRPRPWIGVVDTTGLNLQRCDWSASPLDWTPLRAQHLHREVPTNRHKPALFNLSVTKEDGPSAIGCLPFYKPRRKRWML